MPQYGWLREADENGDVMIPGDFGTEVFNINDDQRAHRLKVGVIYSMRAHNVPFPVSMKFAKHNHLPVHLGYMDHNIEDFSEVRAQISRPLPSRQGSSADVATAITLLRRELLQEVKREADRSQQAGVYLHGVYVLVCGVYLHCAVSIYIVVCLY